MRERWTLICVGLFAAMVAAPRLCAQTNGEQKTQSNAPVAAQFVSGPGQMVSGPGQVVNGPGQRVMGPGATVAPPPEVMVPSGQTVSPTPGVIGAFYKPEQQSSSAGSSAAGQAAPGGSQQALAPGRNHSNRFRYRPEYGAAVDDAAPYATGGTPAASTSATSRMVRRGGFAGGSMIAVPPRHATGYGAQAPSYTDAESGNRPRYRPEAEMPEHKPANAPNVIQSQEPVLTIVMKNGSKLRVRNYALTPQMLLDLDGAGNGRETEIPLSAINLKATEKAAAQAGLSFAVPTN